MTFWKNYNFLYFWIFCFAHKFTECKIHKFISKKIKIKEQEEEAEVVYYILCKKKMKQKGEYKVAWLITVNNNSHGIYSGKKSSRNWSGLLTWINII